MDAATDTTPQAAPAENDGWEWCRVEIFGHRCHHGRAREEERFGSKMLRIDVPIVMVTPAEGPDGKPTLSVERWETYWYGGSSIFSFALSDEATIMRNAVRTYPAHRVRQLSGPGEDDDELDFSDAFDDGDDA